MQLFQASRRSSPRLTEEQGTIKLSIQDVRDQTASRHDSRMLIERTVPADPYQVWLQRREDAGRSSAIPV
jgi:hypothetical protein